MNYQESSVQNFEKFMWKIENFSRLQAKAKEIQSEPFVLCGYPWSVSLFPKGTKNAANHLSIYLEAMQTANMSRGWSRDVELKFAVFNQLNIDRTVTKESDHEFNANEEAWGFSSIIALSELKNLERGFIVKDACIVGVEVFVRKSTNEKPLNQALKLTTSVTGGCETSNMEVEVCNEQADAELALGRVMYFLKTKKVKDMNEQACKDLQALWDELKKFNKFDAAWLEPTVQSSLATRSYVEKALEAEKLKEYMVALELEMERVKTKLDVVEVDRDVERDILKGKGFKEINLDSKLECETWRP